MTFEALTVDLSKLNWTILISNSNRSVLCRLEKHSNRSKTAWRILWKERQQTFVLIKFDTFILKEHMLDMKSRISLILGNKELGNINFGSRWLTWKEVWNWKHNCKRGNFTLKLETTELFCNKRNVSKLTIMFPYWINVSKLYCIVSN